MNPDLELLHPYPFEKLRQLFEDLEVPADKRPIPLSIGEPRHAAPDIARRALVDSLDMLSNYPATRGIADLRNAIGNWLKNRFDLPEIDSESQVIPVSGTREALFAIAQAVVEAKPGATVICPNPFYQIYEGATLLAGATPDFINCTADSGFLPDFNAVSEERWQACQLLYICSPGNPSGAVMPMAQLKQLIVLAREYDFVIASDECYSEIYRDEDEPPPGLLQACAELGDSDFRNCLVFHSLSKRSNLPGLRSGFVAGDAHILKQFLLYRTYQGCALPPHHQMASIAAWSDEGHVVANRQLYRDKFTMMANELSDKLELVIPEAGFYLWPETPVPDTDFARRLFAEEHVTVLPGRYLARESQGENPGENRVRMALVAELSDCQEAAQRISNLLDRL
ncbi:MAG: succinyldiaminopimelate transaminase [Halieaceae bacterium]